MANGSRPLQLLSCKPGVGGAHKQRNAVMIAKYHLEVVVFGIIAFGILVLILAAFNNRRSL
jgi:hypothetical protein